MPWHLLRWGALLLQVLPRWMGLPRSSLRARSQERSEGVHGTEGFASDPETGSPRGKAKEAPGMRGLQAQAIFIPQAELMFP